MAHNIYAAELAPLKLGIPLWIPEPQDCDEVCVGDVGYLQDGAFYRLFNCTLPANHPSNQVFGVPENFTPLQMPPNSITHPLSHLVPGPIYGGSVRELQGEVGTTSGYVSLLCSKAPP